MPLSLVTLSRARPGRKKFLNYLSMKLLFIFFPDRPFSWNCAGDLVSWETLVGQVCKLSSTKSLSFTKIFQKPKGQRGGRLSRTLAHHNCLMKAMLCLCYKYWVSDSIPFGEEKIGVLLKYA